MGSVAAGMGAGPEISKVSGIESAGEEFMKTVFRLRPNEVGTAFNAPQTIVYVVRPTEFTPDYSERWKQFQSEPFVRYAAVAQMDQNAVVRAWFDEIKRDAGFQWAEGRDPQLLVEREREE